jgi:hypothetical protein
VIIGYEFGMHSLAFHGGTTICMFPIGASWCGIYLLIMRVEWAFGLIESGMINIICLLTKYIENEVVSCKVFKVQKTKKKVISLFLKNLCEKM